MYFWKKLMISHQLMEMIIMNNEINYKIKIRKAREDDNLIEIAELIYDTDQYISILV